MLTRFGRWALGLYPPSVPVDLRLTDVRPVESGLSQIHSTRVALTDADRSRLQRYQQRQHDTRNELTELIGDRETLEEQHRRREQQV